MYSKCNNIDSELYNIEMYDQKIQNNWNNTIPKIKIIEKEHEMIKIKERIMNETASTSSLESSVTGVRVFPGDLTHNDKMEYYNDDENEHEINSLWSTSNGNIVVKYKLSHKGADKISHIWLTSGPQLVNENDCKSF